jgi:hypothetical protein
MTAPAPETVEREREKLYVTDAELIRRLGVPEKEGRRVLRELTTKSLGFPKKQKLFGDRYYWPAIRAYFDRINGMLPVDAARPITENRDRSRLPRHSQRSHQAEGHPDE